MASPSSCAARVNDIETLELLPGLDLTERVGYLTDNKRMPDDTGRRRSRQHAVLSRSGERKELGVSVHIYAGYVGCQLGW
jgi:hypothetical protein